jgi:hypothetical protein
VIAVPVEGEEMGGNGVGPATRILFGLGVEDGGPVVDAAQFSSRSGDMEHRFTDRCLAVS